MTEPLFTAEEFALMDKLSSCVNDWNALTFKHPNEMEEVVFYVHGLQRLLMAHAAMRAFPDYFTQPGALNTPR